MSLCMLTRQIVHETVAEFGPVRGEEGADADHGVVLEVGGDAWGGRY